MPNLLGSSAMLAWLVDHANAVYLILGFIVLALGVSWWLNRRVRTLLVAAGIVGLMILFWLLTLVVPTDRKQIQANLWAMGRAVLNQKPDDLTKHWSRDFTYNDRKRDELAKAITEASRQFKVEGINLWGFDLKSVTEEKAEIWFQFKADADGGSFWKICRAHFVKEGDDWKLTRVAFFQPGANTDQEIRLPIGR